MSILGKQGKAKTAVRASPCERNRPQQECQEQRKMHNRKPLTSSAQSLDCTLLEAPGYVRIGAATRTMSGFVYELPPGRDDITADIRTINHRSFRMLCDMNRGLLASLAPVPEKLVLAARHLIELSDSGDRSGLWLDTFTYYVESLTNARVQLRTMARLHGLHETGHRIVEAIEVLENITPAFAEVTPGGARVNDKMKTAVEQLATASVTIAGSLADLLCAVECALDRVDQVGDSAPPVSCCQDSSPKSE